MKLTETKLTSFGRFIGRETDPKLNNPKKIEPTKTPLATNPVTARIRKTQFGSSTAVPTGINVAEASKKGQALLSKAPKLSIRRLK